MNKIEVKVIQQPVFPGATMAFMAKLTQRGHNISCMDDLMDLYSNSCMFTKPSFMETLTQLPHGEIQRFTPITVAIVGASRRFLMQARTHKVGVNYVSASCQYSDYSDSAGFVVPYEIIEAGEFEVTNYLAACDKAMCVYNRLVEKAGNDAAGYVAPQGLRNVLIMQMNHDSWKYFIKLRGCNRNTTETKYVTWRIWEELLKTTDGEHLFKFAGPDCLVYNTCPEGHMTCRKPLGTDRYTEYLHEHGVTVPRALIDTNFPLLKGDCR